MPHLALIFEEKFRQLFEATPLPEELRRAASFALFPGGKRFRPLLALHTATLFGPLERGWEAAAALETLHTYSLIHDDLPCLDNDDMRRGRPSLHRAFGEATALLTGDFFLTWSFELLSKADHFSSDEKILLIQTLSGAAGGAGMVGGQLLEIDLPPSSDLLSIYRQKTGGLIEAAILFGGVIGRAQDLEKLKRLGKHLGLAFQLQDDLSDYEEDLKAGKKTMGTLYGKEALQTLLQKEQEAAFQAVGPKDWDKLKPFFEDIKDPSFSLVGST